MTEELFLSTAQKDIEARMQIPGSKSESNRLLILQAQYPQIKLKNLSNSDDTKVLRKALQEQTQILDIGHAGTAMRFLTAYLAFNPGQHILTGSSRMQERPIKILVEALRHLGAQIDYQKKEGYPPLLITGSQPIKSLVKIPANVSSQFISALLLIAPKLPTGLTIQLEGKILSRPYIQMTLDLLGQLGIEYTFEEQTLKVLPKKEIDPKTFSIESDWSAASYFYSIAALSNTSSIKVGVLRKDSLQGDAEVANFYRQLGVTTYFKKDFILLKKGKNFNLPQKFEADLIDYPDLAQTIAVTCSGLGIDFKLTGLDNLRIKETDRLQALQNELTKFGVRVAIEGNTLIGFPPTELNPNISIQTYQDHRMAMAFAPLALKTPLSIQNPEVVSKSFPRFWEALKKCYIPASEKG